MPSPKPPNTTQKSTPVVVEVPHAGEAAELLRKLDELEEADNRHHPQPVGPTRWMLPYADVMTLLFGLFLVLYLGVQQQMAPLQQRHEALKVRHAKLRQQLSHQKQEVVVLKDNLSHLRSQLDQWQAKTANTGIHFRRSGEDLVVTLDEQILFAPGQSTLDPKAKQTLGQLAKILATSLQPLRIEGHTDNTPIHTAQYPSNWELSSARAMAILRELAEKHHLPASRLAAAGYGQFRPIADNSTVEGKQKNRRVDIVIMGQSLPTTSSGLAASPTPAVVHNNPAALQSSSRPTPEQRQTFTPHGQTHQTPSPQTQSR